MDVHFKVSIVKGSNANDKLLNGLVEQHAFAVFSGLLTQGIW
jgi:hypothetical protein